MIDWIKVNSACERFKTELQGSGLTVRDFVEGVEILPIAHEGGYLNSYHMELIPDSGSSATDAKLAGPEQ